MGVGVGWTQGSMHVVVLRVKVWGIFFFFFLRMTLYFHSNLGRGPDNVRGLCPRLSIHVSFVYCSKIDLSF